MWTAREKVLADIDEINQYLKNIDFFHDYKLGNVQFDKSAKNIFIEDYSENALVWDFSFENVSEFETILQKGRTTIALVKINKFTLINL